MKLLLTYLALLLFSSVHGQIGYDIKPLKLDRYGGLMDCPKGFKPIKLSKEEAATINLYVLDDQVSFDTSTTIVNDTVGCHYKGEYLWFPQLTSHVYHKYLMSTQRGEDSVQYISPWVTNKDYQLFRDYVRDSLMRKKLIEEDRDPEKWGIEVYEDDGVSYDREDLGINYESKYKYMLSPEGSADPNQSKYGKRDVLRDFFYSEHDRNGGPFKIDQRKLVYQFYWLNLKSIDNLSSTKDSSKVHPFTSDPISGKRDLDMEIFQKKGQNGAIRGHVDRSRFIISEAVPLIRDTGFWYRTDLPDNYKEWLTENYTTIGIYQNMPVLGMTGYQAWAYCKWKEKVYTDLGMKNQNVYFPMYVEIDLPRKVHAEKYPNELPRLIVPAVNNEWWRISNEDYQNFIRAVQDSLIRKFMGDVHFGEYGLIPTYDIKGNSNDVDDWVIDYSKRTDFTAKNVEDAHLYFRTEFVFSDTTFWTDHGMIHPDKLNYEYGYISFDRANEIGHFVKKHWQLKTKYKHNMPEFELYEFDSLSSEYGKDLCFATFNKLGNDPGVRTHKIRSQFFIQETVNIYPNIPGKGTLIPYDFDSCPDCTVQNITWGQAKAYYHWYINKRRGHQKMTKKNPTAKMKPTREQWESMMKGEKVTLPQKIIELPVPAFRYVIK